MYYHLISNKLFPFSILFILISCNLYCQPNKTDYIFPIKPGQINALAGTMGELRSTHFHTGLDIKTDGVVGLPVHAAKEGYISRISVSGGGYGNALYLKHPDGNTTVYAHLLKFTDSLANYVLQEQYTRKSFSLNIYPEVGEMTVEKGEIIAFAGNSGSSSGPHLHWDLRDAYQRPINPLKYGFSEIRDTQPPLIVKMAFTPIDATSRINGLYERLEIPVFKSAGTFLLNRNVSLEGNIGLEFLGYDKLDDSYNLCGINDIVVNVNQSRHFELHIDKLSFAMQRSIYRFYNYREKLDDNERFHTLYINDGNKLPFYKDSENGIIRFEKEGKEEIEIIFTDSYGNSSQVKFNNNGGSVTRLKNRNIEYEIHENFILINDIFRDPYVHPKVYFGNKWEEVEPLEDATNPQYLLDLRKELPNRIIIDQDTLIFNFKHRIYPNRNYTYYSNSVDINFSNNSLFDTLYLETNYRVEQLDSSTNREIFEIGNIYTPLKGNINVTLKPTKLSNIDKTSVYSLDENGNMYYQNTVWEKGKANFSTNYFGKFTFEKDETGPVIIPQRLRNNEVSFIISDNLSGIKDFNAKINNEWLLMKYDPKNARIWSERLDKSETFKGELVLEITDNENNTTTFNHKFE